MATEPQQNEEVLERFIFSLVPSHLSTSSRAHSPFFCRAKIERKTSPSCPGVQIDNLLLSNSTNGVFTISMLNSDETFFMKPSFWPFDFFLLVMMLSALAVCSIKSNKKFSSLFTMHNGMLSKCVIFTSNFNGRDPMSLCMLKSRYDFYHHIISQHTR